MNRSNRKRLPVPRRGERLLEGKRQHDLAALLLMPPRSSKTRARGPCGSCSGQSKQGCIKRHGWRFMGLGGCVRRDPWQVRSLPPISVRKLVDFRSGWPVVQNAGNFCDSPRRVGGVGFNYDFSNSSGRLRCLKSTSAIT
jgi:hypothetical protein